MNKKPFLILLLALFQSAHAQTVTNNNSLDSSTANVLNSSLAGNPALFNIRIGPTFTLESNSVSPSSPSKINNSENISNLSSGNNSNANNSNANTSAAMEPESQNSLNAAKPELSLKSREKNKSSLSSSLPAVQDMGFLQELKRQEEMRHIPQPSSGIESINKGSIEYYSNFNKNK